MSLDKTAIQEIKKGAHIPELIEQLEKVSTTTPVIIGVDGTCVENLEMYMPHRKNYRGKFHTNNTQEFITYCTDFAQKGSICFVDSEQMHASMIIDNGTVENPLHREHKAVLSLKKSAAFAALLNAANNHLSQKSASDFIEDWDDHMVICLSDGKPISPKKAAAALRDLSIERAREIGNKIDDFGSEKSDMEKIEAKNKEKIPAEIEFKCIPYSGFNEIKIKLKIGIITGEDKPKINLRTLKWELLKEELTEEFKDFIIEGIQDSKTKVFIGTF